MERCAKTKKSLCFIVSLKLSPCRSKQMCFLLEKKINIIKLIIRLSSKSTLEQRIKGACTCISAQSISSYYLQLRSPIRCNMYCFKPKFWLSSHGYMCTTCMHIWNENEFASLMNIVKELTKNFINLEHWAVFFGNLITTKHWQIE